MNLHELDNITVKHQENVSKLCLSIGREMDLSNEKLNNLVNAAKIHDIGKMGVPQNILDNPGKPSEDDFNIIKTHTVIGDEICKDKGYSDDVRNIVRHHHEKLNGSGYPDGLKGAELNLETRIVAVADIFEALTAERQYKKPLSKEQALSLIDKYVEKGELDRTVVKALKRFIEREMTKDHGNKDIVQEINQLKTSNVENILKRELNNILDRDNINGKISTRIKDVHKAIEKMSRKGYTDVKQMTDLVGGKIVVTSINDIYKLKDKLAQTYNVFEVNDFIQNPQSSGYRSLHLDLNVKNQRVEIQIKTHEMEKAQSITHDTLYKNLPEIQELKMPIVYLSRNIYDYYTDKDKFFEKSDINQILKNPLVNYIEKENLKAMERIDSLEKQKALIDIQEDKFTKAKIYLTNIDKYNDQNVKTSIINKIFGKDSNNKNSDNIKIYKEKLESLGVRDWNDYETQYNNFNKIKEEMTKKIDNEKLVNREQVKLFNNVKNVIEEIEHNDVKELYRDYPQSQSWDKNITNKISTLNHYYEKKLSIDEIKGLAKDNQLAKSILKAIDKIFGKDKGITR